MPAVAPASRARMALTAARRPGAVAPTARSRGLRPACSAASQVGASHASLRWLWETGAPRQPVFQRHHHCPERRTARCNGSISVAMPLMRKPPPQVGTAAAAARRPRPIGDTAAQACGSHPRGDVKVFHPGSAALALPAHRRRPVGLARIFGARVQRRAASAGHVCSTPRICGVRGVVDVQVGQNTKLRGLVVEKLG